MKNLDLSQILTNQRCLVVEYESGSKLVFSTLPGSRCTIGSKTAGMTKGGKACSEVDDLEVIDLSVGKVYGYLTKEEALALNAEMGKIKVIGVALDEYPWATDDLTRVDGEFNLGIASMNWV